MGRIWNAVTALTDALGRMGDETAFVKPDTRPRKVMLVKCPECGMTQLIGGPVEPGRVTPERQTRRCAGYKVCPCGKRSCEMSGPCSAILCWHSARGEMELVA
jgi:hypothetical protein